MKTNKNESNITKGGKKNGEKVRKKKAKDINMDVI